MSPRASSIAPAWNRTSASTIRSRRAASASGQRGVLAGRPSRWSAHATASAGRTVAGRAGATLGRRRARVGRIAVVGLEEGEVDVDDDAGSLVQADLGPREVVARGPRRSGGAAAAWGIAERDHVLGQRDDVRRSAEQRDRVVEVAAATASRPSPASDGGWSGTPSRAADTRRPLGPGRRTRRAGSPAATGRRRCSPALGRVRRPPRASPRGRGAAGRAAPRGTRRGPGSRGRPAGRASRRRRRRPRRTDQARPGRRPPPHGRRRGSGTAGSRVAPWPARRRTRACRAGSQRHRPSPTHPRGPRGPRRTRPTPAVEGRIGRLADPLGEGEPEVPLRLGVVGSPATIARSRSISATVGDRATGGAARRRRAGRDRWRAGRGREGAAATTGWRSRRTPAPRPTAGSGQHGGRRRAKRGAGAGKRAGASIRRVMAGIRRRERLDHPARIQDPERIQRVLDRAHHVDDVRRRPARPAPRAAPTRCRAPPSPSRRGRAPRAKISSGPSRSAAPPGGRRGRR